MDNFTETLTGSKARAKILAGVNKVVDAVKLTLGPEGRNALLPRTYNRGPRITNDGVTVSENIKLKDEHESLAAEAFKEGSKKTNELAGDGTTTTAVLGGHLINKIFREIDAKSSTYLQNTNGGKGVRAIRKELKDAKDIVIQKIKDRAKKVESLEELQEISVVSIGKEDEEVAKTVAKMVWEMGVDNHIDVVEGYKGTVETEVVKGMRMPAKAIRNFVNNAERFEMVAEDTPVMITNEKIENPFEIIKVVQGVTPKVAKLAIFAPDFSTVAIKGLIELNNIGGVFIYPVKCPSLRTEQLEDLAAYTGATVIDKDTGRRISSLSNTDLGFATKIVVKDTEAKEDAVIMGGRGEKMVRMDDESGTNRIKDRIETLKKQLGESRNELTTLQLQKRIANLSAAVGVIRVGASTSKEGLFLKLKIEDGVFACKAALEEGYVKGGGLCLKEIADELGDNILADTLREPYEQIQKNAGGNLEIGSEIIDPAKVVRLEVEHGVSVAASMITCDITIPEVREKGPGEGYSDIAKAISKYAYYWAKEKGLVSASEREANEDMDKRFEEVMIGDK